MPLRDLFFAAFTVGMLPVCLFRPWIGVLMWTWIGMMNPQWLMFGFARDMPWAMLVGVATIVGVALSRDRKPVPWNLQLVLMLVLLTYFAFTTAFAWVPEAAGEKLELLAKVIFMAVLGTTVIYGRTRIRALLLVIALGIGYYGIKGGAWAIASGGGNRVWGPDGGFIAGNNALGVALLMVIPLMLALARERQQKWTGRALRIGALLSCAAVVCTYSRGAMLGLAACAPLLFLHAKRKLAFALIVVPVVVIGAMYAPEKLFQRAETIGTYESDGSAMQRIAAWSVAVNSALASPLTGGGFDFYQTENQQRWFDLISPGLRKYLHTLCAAHSIYFQILGEHGFVALALYLSLLVSTLRRCSRLQKQTAGDRDFSWIGEYAGAIRIGLIGYMVSGAFLSIALFDLAWIYYSFTSILARELAGREARRERDHAVTARLRPSRRPAMQTPQPALARAGYRPTSGRR